MRALSGGPEGGKPKKFCQKIGQKAKFHKMCHFVQVKILAWKVNKSKLTYGTRESQTFSQKPFTKKSRVNLVSSKVIG